MITLVYIFIRKLLGSFICLFIYFTLAQGECDDGEVRPQRPGVVGMLLPRWHAVHLSGGGRGAQSPAHPS